MGTILSIEVKAKYNTLTKDIELGVDHTPVMTLRQLHHLVRLANVEYGLAPSKGFSFHLFDLLYRFNRKEAINFLMVGVGEEFFECPKDVILSLVGRYFLGKLENIVH